MENSELKIVNIEESSEKQKKQKKEMKKGILGFLLGVGLTTMAISGLSDNKIEKEYDPNYALYVASDAHFETLNAPNAPNSIKEAVLADHAESIGVNAIEIVNDYYVRNREYYKANQDQLSEVPIALSDAYQILGETNYKLVMYNALQIMDLPDNIYSISPFESQFNFEEYKNTDNWVDRYNLLIEKVHEEQNDAYQLVKNYYDSHSQNDNDIPNEIQLAQTRIGHFATSLAANHDEIVNNGRSR